MGTSLWIVPDEQDTKRLKTIMQTTRQNERANFPSSYPDFHPHVTLASFPNTSTPPPPSEIRAALEPVLEHRANSRPEPPRIQLHFHSLEIGTHFFRSVYISIAHTPALRALHAAVHGALGIAPRTEAAFPHVSLCYVDDADADVGERGRFLCELEEGGRVRYREGEGGRRVSLWCGEGEGEEGWWMEGFVPREVWVVKCDGPVEGWTVLDKMSIV